MMYDKPTNEPWPKFTKTEQISMNIPAKVGGIVVGEFYQEVDGLYKFEPTKYKAGYWDEYMLMTILCKLRKLNIEWELFMMTDPRISNMWDDENE